MSKLLVYQLPFQFCTYQDIIIHLCAEFGQDLRVRMYLDFLTLWPPKMTTKPLPGLILSLNTSGHPNTPFSTVPGKFWGCASVWIILRVHLIARHKILILRRTMLLPALRFTQHQYKPSRCLDMSFGLNWRVRHIMSTWSQNILTTKLSLDPP